ncbi:cytochrome P450 6g1-like isoform X1 [Diabrotica virgifera virgifera]|uniref:Uncharacterized protein n=2 Tax=Diabrotica virgifera virgifera TaxID=50390 RepID=A0ABM5K6S0_DIAVI|nr:cytochrome P450 6g1-like isoform X1 [Diabrotica virgifera virgifera]
MSLFLTLLGNGIALLLVAAVSFHAYFLYSYTYWSKKGVPYLEPKFPYGNCTSLFVKGKGYPVGLSDSCYKKIREKVWKVGGFFTIARPTLLVLDPEYVRDILIKIAQVSIFFVGGFEASSSTMTFALYELAKHPELQDRLRDEIMTVLNDKKELTYRVHQRNEVPSASY